MTSDRKAQANRRNALKNTGPKTPEGKATVSLNALRHGLRSEVVLLTWEGEEPWKVGRKTEGRSATGRGA